VKPALTQKGRSAKVSGHCFHREEAEGSPALVLGGLGSQQHRGQGVSVDYALP